MANATGSGHVYDQLAALGARLRAARIARGVSQGDFGALGGVGLSTQKKYELGDTTPTAEYFYNLRQHGINIVDLLVGDAPHHTNDDGAPVPHVSPPTPDHDFVEVVEIDLAYGLGGTFSGDPVEVETHYFPRAWIERITNTPASMLTFARGRGDSMQPTILDGDMVLIDRSQKTVREWDAIWALTVGEMAMIKRIRARGERVHILSDNDRVPPEDVFHEEVNIVGRVIFIGRKV